MARGKSSCYANKVWAVALIAWMNATVAIFVVSLRKK